MKNGSSRRRFFISLHVQYISIVENFASVGDVQCTCIKKPFSFETSHQESFIYSLRNID